MKADVMEAHNFELSVRLGPSRAAWRDGLGQLRVVNLDRIGRWAVCVGAAENDHCVIMVGVDGSFICYQPCRFEDRVAVTRALETVLSAGGFVDLRDVVESRTALLDAFSASRTPEGLGAPTRTEDAKEAE